MTEEVEHLAGREVVRDPDTGQFKRVKLDPQTASEMNAKRKLGASSIQQLLEEQGYNNTDNKAPEYIKVMARQAVKHTAAMSHWRRVHALSDQSEGAGLNRPKPGEQCPLCNQFNNWTDNGRGVSELVRLIKDEGMLDEAATASSDAAG
jgi:hypothetical protein